VSDNGMLAILVTIVYVTLAIATGRRGARAGRNESRWLLYGALVPVISFIHATILVRRSDTGMRGGTQ